MIISNALTIVAVVPGQSISEFCHSEIESFCCNWRVVLSNSLISISWLADGIDTFFFLGEFFWAA